MKKYSWLFFIFIFSFTASGFAEDTAKNNTTGEGSSISSNPAAVNIGAGTGDLQSFLYKKLHIQNDHGIYFGGAWLGDANTLISGGAPNAQQWTYNSLFLFNLSVDTKQLGAWKGGLFATQILQFNGNNTNGAAGTVQGYNSLPGATPLDRFELYQIWYRQALFNDKLYTRIGKSLPNDDFDNVIKPVPLKDEKLSLPAVSGLIFTPLFVNTTMLGVMPGYYNSAYGVSADVTPIKNWYASGGIYDGNLAQGKQTGLTGPTFNGAYFDIGETGFDWVLGKYNKPGIIGAGLWHQTGLILNTNLSENDATGFYLFGSQRLWYRDPGDDNSGISAFYQFGDNNSDVLSMTRYIGGGITAYGLMPHRADDSFGVGLAYSWLNQRIYTQATELMLQTYYQLHITNDIYAEPVLSFIPDPGRGQNIDPTWAGTFRLIALF